MLILLQNASYHFQITEEFRRDGGGGGCQSRDRSSRLHFNIVSVKPLDIFKKPSGQFPAEFVAVFIILQSQGCKTVPLC